VSKAARFLELRVRIPPAEGMFVSCECCVLSGRGLYNGPITIRGVLPSFFPTEFEKRKNKIYLLTSNEQKSNTFVVSCIPVTFMCHFLNLSILSHHFYILVSELLKIRKYVIVNLFAYVERNLTNSVMLLTCTLEFTILHLGCLTNYPDFLLFCSALLVTNRENASDEVTFACLCTVIN
jgi:hypothetical protein